MPEKFSPSITLFGETYPVNRFKDTHLLPILHLLSEGLDDLNMHSKAGMAIKEVIVPSISDSIISINPRGLYIIHLESEELNYLLLQILANYYEFQLINARKARKPQADIDIIEAKLDDTKASIADALGANPEMKFGDLDELDNSDSSQESDSSKIISLTGEPTAIKNSEPKDSEIEQLQARLKALQED